MIDEKTREPMQEAPSAPPVKHKRTLRSLWAQLQCSRLLQKHRFRRKTQRRMNDLSQKLRGSALVLRVGETLYALGFAAEYAVVRTGRNISAVARWLAHGIRNVFHELAALAFPGAAQMFRDLFGPVILFFRGTGALLVHARAVRKEKGFGAAVKDSVHYLTSGIRRNLRLLPRMAMYILPVCMLAVFVTVFDRTIQQPYALAVQVNGKTVGYVANEEVFNLAREDVMERINYAGTDKTDWTIEPSYTITVAHQVMDESETADAILKSASDEISEGTALYLNGELTAVCADGDALRSYLNSLLAPYEEEYKNDGNVTVGFNKTVLLEDGIYFNDSFEDDNSIEDMISGVRQQEKTYMVQNGDTLWSIAQKNDLTFRELCALNPNFKGAALTESSNIQEGDTLIVTKEEATLEVRITKIETRQEEVPFTTETTQSNEYTKGTTKTLQEGENGLRLVTLQNVYDANGTLLEQTVVSTQTLKEAVPKKGGRRHQEGDEQDRLHHRQRPVHLAGAQLPLLLALVRQRPQGRGHLRTGRYAHLCVGRRHRDQGGLQQGRCRHGLWLLGHHQPLRRLYHGLCPLPVADRQCRPERPSGPAYRLRGQHRAFQRQPLPL